MKIFDNGVIREMTPEEINQDKETDSVLSASLPPEDDRTIMEEFIDRLSEANTMSEVKEIAKDIKDRIG